MNSDAVVTMTLNPCVDKTFVVDVLVADKKLKASDVSYYPGGGGINVARAVCQLGGKATAFWSCGGPVGERLFSLLEQEDIHQRIVHVVGGTRENLILTERNSGKQYRIGMPGERLSQQEKQDWLEQVRHLSEDTKYLVISGSLPEETSFGWFKELLQSIPTGIRVIVDSKGEALNAALDVGVYAIKPNIGELSQIVGRKLDDASLRKEVRKIIDTNNVRVVLVSLGRGGALLATKDDLIALSSPSVPVKSKVGAGDSMVGGFVKALVERKGVISAAKYGVAAGAAAVMTEGTELCRKEDVERLWQLMQQDAAKAYNNVG